MYFGFPIQLISSLCCTKDSAALELSDNCQLSEDGGFVRHGTLRCSNCNAAFAIDDGILNMLNVVALDNESKHELQLRNEHYSKTIKVTEPVWWENEHNAMEMNPTLEALLVSQDNSILELGCGDGRYTVILAGLCSSLLAVDFSIESLRILQYRLQEKRIVGLVLGDVTTLKIRAASFDRVFSTLVSNLPTREHRNALYHLSAKSLIPNGRFVFSTHNFGYYQKKRSEKKSGRYTPDGIYRYIFTVSECEAEIRPYFKAVKAGPIQIYIPFTYTLHKLGCRLPLVALSRLLERVPILNNGLGNLILCTAEHPTRSDLNVGNAK